MKQCPSSKKWADVILNYLGKFCVWCKSTTNLHIHHVLPLSRGGKNELANLEIVCQICHLKLHFQIGRILYQKRINKSYYRKRK